MRWNISWELKLLGVFCLALATQAEEEKRAGVLCENSVLPRLGWGKTFGDGAMGDGVEGNELWLEVDWPRTSEWGIGNRFRLHPPLQLHKYQTVSLEVRSDPKDGDCVAYLGIENEMGAKLTLPISRGEALDSTWKKVRFNIASLQDKHGRRSSFLPASEWNSVIWVKVFFLNKLGKDANATEKIWFRNVTIEP